MTKKVGTIRDVARDTGLSTATISRALNGTGKVAEETRAKVQEACRRLNYLPNPAARALTTNRSRTIAALIPSIDHSLYAKFIASVEATLAERDYSLVFAVTGGDQDVEYDAVRKLLGMGAEAVLLSGATHSSALHELLTSRSIPYLHTSVWNPNSTTPTIGYDNHALAEQAIGYLLDLGHRNILVLHGPEEQSDRTRARCAGARAAAGTDQLTFVQTSLDVTGAKEAVLAAFEDGWPVTAILCFSDILALGVYFAMSDLGKSIPDDVSVMGFDNLDWTASAVPPLTTMNLPARKMGSAAARQLMAAVEDGKALIAEEFAGEIVVRSSVCAVVVT